MTYVIQLDGAHVLPFACRHPRRFAIRRTCPFLFRNRREDDGAT
jgi:hypothetical protein